MQKAHPQKRGCAFLYLFRVRALNHASWIWRKADFYLLPFIEAIICHTSDKNGDKYISQPYCLIEIS